MKKKSFLTTGISAGATFGILKALQNSADPYTRIAIGGIGGLGALIIGGADFKAIGMGIFLGSGLQGYEIINGGRITKNEYPQTIYALHETEGTKELPAGTLPDYNCDGFTFKGLNGVYKICDGVHCQIYKDGKVNFSGLGALVNKTKGGGLHDLNWCKNTGDPRWVELYNKSV